MEIFAILVSFWYGDVIASERFTTKHACETYVEKSIEDIDGQHIHNKNNGDSYEIHVDNGDIYFAKCVPVDPNVSYNYGDK